MLKVVKGSNELAFTNRVYVSPTDFQKFAREGAAIGISISKGDPQINLLCGTTFVFLASPLPSLAEGEISLNSKQRTCCSFMLNEEVRCRIFPPSAEVALVSMTLNIGILGKGGKVEVTADDLGASFKDQFGSQIFCVGQQLAFNFEGKKFELAVTKFDHAVIAAGGPEVSRGNRGQLLEHTVIDWQLMESSVSNLEIIGNGPDTHLDLFKKDTFDFQSLGIGGLDEQFTTMFRTAFASRLYPGIVRELGINFVRGILLYGPPGCGKTLIARQIGRILNAREPKIVNGPEVLDKYVGGSEEKIRELFKDAEKEQAEKGERSQLHIIIFDEMDAIMKHRGSSGSSSGVGDTVVNQLLSKIDGVDSLNNILIIGMTNRKDMIDEAILRPGRLEIHIEITLPTEEGRVQILNIKTQKMKENNRITQDVMDKLPLLANLTKNFTGAELEGLVRNAASFALDRNIDKKNLQGSDPSKVKLEWGDFENALRTTTPAFGNKDNQAITDVYRNGIFSYGEPFEDLWSTLQRLMNQTKNSKRTPLMTVMLEGNVGTGKSALAAKLAAESDFPFIRMISPDMMIGEGESAKSQKLRKIFQDSYKSPLSIIFIDDIERIIEYTPVGHRFSNLILQTLLVLIRKVPPVGCKLMIVATTSIASLMEDVQLTQAFNVCLHVSELQSGDEVKFLLERAPDMNFSGREISSIAGAVTKPIGVKQLFMVLEMARDENTSRVSADNFLECLHTIGF